MSTASPSDPLAHLRFVTMKQLSEITTYTPQHLYRLVRQQRLAKPLRMGPNRIVFRVEDIERFISERQTRPANDNNPAKR